MLKQKKPGERDCAEHEKSEAERSSTLPAVMEMLQSNNGSELELDDSQVEEVFTNLMNGATEGAGLDFESSNRVNRTRSLVPGQGARAALLMVHQISKITDAELAMAIMQWKLEKIAMKKGGQN